MPCFNIFVIYSQKFFKLNSNSDRISRSFISNKHRFILLISTFPSYSFLCHQVLIDLFTLAATSTFTFKVWPRTACWKIKILLFVFILESILLYNSLYVELSLPKSPCYSIYAISFVQQFSGGTQVTYKHIESIILLMVYLELLKKAKNSLIES